MQASHNHIIGNHSGADDTGNPWRTSHQPIFRVFILLLGTLLISATIVASNCGPQVVYTDASATGANDGSSWADAFTDLQDALTLAAGCGDVDSIYVAQGPYFPDNGSDRSRSFDIPDGIVVLGGFPAGGSSVAVRDWVVYQTVLSGDIDGNGLLSGNSYHVVSTTNTSSQTILDGFIITAGHANGPVSADRYGAGMINTNSDIILSNLSITANTSFFDGGGMANYSGAPTLINVRITGNTADYGGGILNDGSAPTLVNVLITENTAEGDGGGIYNYNSSDPTLINVTITGNSALRGGGIYNSDSAPTLSNVIIWNNTADGANNTPGASIDNSNGISSLVSYCLIANSGGSDNWNASIGIDSGNNIDADPHFANAGSGDYTLLLLSPAIDAGDPATSPGIFPVNNADEPIDVGGNLRFTGGTIDIGAHEFEGPFCSDYPGVIFVDASATGAGTGVSWTDAFPNLQDAFNKRANCLEIDSVFVAQGTYYPDEGNDRFRSFQLQEGVVLLGGFPTGGSPLSGRDWETYQTILSGNIGSPGTSNDNSYHVVRASGVSAATALDGFIISGGRANHADFPDYNGGGVFNIDGSSPTLSNLLITGNTCSDTGGGMYIDDGSNPVITNVTFSSNTAEYGGAIAILSSSPFLSKVTFMNNHSVSSGGAMFSAFLNNSPELVDVVFLNNSSGYSGGAIYHGHFSNMILRNVNFSGNSSSNSGGGLFSTNNDLQMVNVLFSNNTSGNHGGACYSSNSVLSMLNVTMVNNTATNDGGGMYNSSGILELVNTIIWGNMASGSGITPAASISNTGSAMPVISYSLIANSGGSGNWNATIGIDGGNNIDVNPLFIDSGNGDYRIHLNSPASDAGDAETEPALFPINTNGDPIDLNGNFRHRGLFIDMGSYESDGTICSDYTSIVYVDASAIGEKLGISWSVAYTKLQDALTMARNCPDIDTIFVAEGIYFPDDGDDRSRSFDIPDGMVVLGGFPSGGGSLLERNPALNATILSGDIDDNGQLSGNSYHVVRTEGVSEATYIEGFLITGGNADGSSFPDNVGGGWFNDGSGAANLSNPTIVNCRISGNQASTGGGMFNHGAGGESSPVITNSAFTGNYVTSGGGAIYNNGMDGGESSPVLTNCVFTVNSATNAGLGGVLYNNAANGGTCSPVMANSIVYNNAAGNGSTIMYNQDATPVVRYSMFGAGYDAMNVGCTNCVDTTGGGNLFSQNPLFVQALAASAAPTTAGDFRLTEMSPAINAGDPATDAAGFPVNDNSDPVGLDWQLRYASVSIDMGPFEYQGTTCEDFPGVVFVDVAASGDGSGTLWANAYTDLQEAILRLGHCHSVDTIFVAEGSYFPTSGADRVQSFEPSSGTVILGGFPTGGSMLAGRDWEANETILSGDIGNPGDISDNSYHIFRIPNTISGLVIDGFILQDALANNLLPTGAGIYNVGEMTVRNSTIRNCISSNSGAALFNDGVCTIDGCFFLNNNSMNNGADIYNATDAELNVVNINIIQD